MLNFPNITQIEALFSEMEPENLTGETFTPSLHTEDIVLEDIPAEPEEDEEVSALAQSGLGQYTVFSVSEIPVPLAAIDSGVVVPACGNAAVRSSDVWSGTTGPVGDEQVRGTDAGLFPGESGVPAGPSVSTAVGQTARGSRRRRGAPSGGRAWYGRA